MENAARRRQCQECIQAAAAQHHEDEKFEGGNGALKLEPDPVAFNFYFVRARSFTPLRRNALDTRNGLWCVEGVGTDILVTRVLVTHILVLSTRTCASMYVHHVTKIAYYTTYHMLYYVHCILYHVSHADAKF